MTFHLQNGYIRPDGRMDGRTDESMDGQTNGQMDLIDVLRRVEQLPRHIRCDFFIVTHCIIDYDVI